MTRGWLGLLWLLRTCCGWGEVALLVWAVGRVSPRRASHFLLSRQEKVTKEKATPLSVSLRFAAGNLRCSEKAGVRRTRSTSLRSNSCGPYPAFSCAPRHSQRGSGSTRRGASLCGECACVPWTFRWVLVAERSDGPTPPLWLRRGAQRFADQGSQLFERSEFCETPRNASTAGCPQLRCGSQTVGSPFLCLLSFGEAKESRSAAGRNSRLLPQQKQTAI